MFRDWKAKYSFKNVCLSIERNTLISTAGILFVVIVTVHKIKTDLLELGV